LNDRNNLSGLELLERQRALISAPFVLFAANSSLPVQTIPYASIAAATFRKLPTLAPRT